MKGAKLNLGIQTKLGQRLLITPQMKQSLNILQMTVTELSTELTNILQENPVLEIVENREDADLSSGEMDQYIENLKKIEWEDFFSDKDDFRYLSSDDDELDYEKFVSRDVSLEEHLIFQLKILGLPEGEEEIGVYIIGNIDENGYLTTSVEEISKDLNVGVEEVEKVLKLIQDFEPSGVGARNLVECISKQLEDMNVVPDDIELIKLIINNHYQLLERKDIKGLSKALDISEEYVEDLLEMIKRTDPKPGLKYYNQIRYIVPDVYVVRKGDEIEIIPNDDSIPSIKINGYYIKMLRDKNLDKDTYEYISEKVKSALWVLKSLNQRKSTIVAVMESIVKFQRDFFFKGFDALKPLKLKDVAEDIGIHESTISRVTSGKYAMTEMGIIEIKTFFVKGFQTDNGNVTTDSVKSMIKSLIDDEDKAKPLSDQKISEILAKKGINIARRTVAKYREELGIPAAAERKNR
ncbi:RNA polymerase factor sigma-54 [Calditerrivibrio sp.]|uniref:RNA polymerase factor sigma-54 n=1 Tax=Calditerrivibrio sp. TaxID=2792612 RepID=UPI003D1033C5